MTDGTIGALAILVLIFATSSIVFFIKALLDKRFLPKRRNMPNATKKREDFYVIKQPATRRKKHSKYSVVSSDNVFELSELDKDFDSKFHR